MHKNSNKHGAANGYDKDFLRIIYPDIHLRRMTYPQERVNKWWKLL